MTNQTRYGGERGKPIRRDRLLIAGLIVVAAILIPVLLKSGCTKREAAPLTVTSDGQTVGTTTPTTTTAPATTASTPSTASDVDTTVSKILSNTSSSSPSSPPATSPSSTPATTKPATSSPAATTSSSTASILSHTAKQGETLQSIASAMGVSVRDLRADNQLYGTDAPAAGRVLYAAKNGLVHTIKRGQTLTDIATTYGITAQAIATANGISTSSTIFAGARLLIPGVSSAFWDNVSTLARGATSQFIWPLQGAVVSEFGWRQHPVLGIRQHHDGIDIDVPEGTTVYASAGGEVYFYGEQPGYGNVVILEHDGGFYTLYGHLKSALVVKGQYVEKGQKIAVSGNTGISSGPHLHFELRNGEFPVDPMSFLP
ncbi:MAG: M23 family metallopeptidase [Candidatus Bipolaricaulota bacterium]|nr:M23 family metallopeptidase [Candidatus Bipolaricaulota bacterium]